MSEPCWSERESLIRAIRGKAVVGLADVRRAMANDGHPLTGAAVSSLLRKFGFRRDGWSGCGYDRTPRYVWPPHVRLRSAQ